MLDSHIHCYFGDLYLVCKCYRAPVLLRQTIKIQTQHVQGFVDLEWYWLPHFQWYLFPQDKHGQVVCIRYLKIYTWCVNFITYKFCKKPPTARNCIMWFKLPWQNFPIVLEIASSSTLKLNDKSNTFSWLAKTEMVYNRLISATAGIIKVCRFGTCNIRTLLINSFSWVYLQIEQLQSFADFSKSSPVAS